MSNIAYINNIQHEFKNGETILEFVRRNYGKDSIPTMCQADNLENFGSCRVCSVDVALEKDGKSKVMASCHTPVNNGFYIYTDSARIKKLRKNIVELLLTDYPEDKVLANKDELPTEFQHTISTIGLPNVRYPKGLNHLGQTVDLSHPYIHSDLSECIKCYRCIRACDEIQSEQVLGMNGRGFNSSIIKGFDENFKDSPCVSCGACVQTCPTNALFDKFRSKTVKPDKEVRTICTYCGVGCNLDVKVVNGEVKGIQAPIDAEVNRGHTCLKGRYAFQFYNHPERLNSPLVRKDGKLVEVSWDEAYDTIAKRFNEIKNEFGPDALAGISSSRCTNEENYLMQKFFRFVIGTNNIDGCARVCHAPTALGMQMAYGAGAATNSVEDLYHTNCILLIGADPTDAHPVTGTRIRAVAMSGVPLIVIDPLKIELARYAKYHLQLRPGTNVALLNMFAFYILEAGLTDDDFIGKRTEEFEGFAAYLRKQDIAALEKLTGVDRNLVKAAAIEYASAANAMEFHGLGVTEHWQGTKAITLLSNIAMMTGNIGRKGVGINPLRGQNNVQGAADMGVQPHQGAGYLDVTKPESGRHYYDIFGIEAPTEVGYKIPEMFDASIKGKLKAMWIMGEDLIQTDPNTCHVEKALGDLDFLVVQELFMTDTAKIADVVLPASSFLEKEGTFTNGERRIQRVQKVVEPISGTKPDGVIVSELMNKMGYPQPAYSAKTMLEEISQVVPFFKGVTWENLGTQGKQWPVKEGGEDTPIMHLEEFKRGLGKFHSWDFEESPELIENAEKYPFIMTTGRILEHYNSGTMTRRTPNRELFQEDILHINPEDAKNKGVESGDFIEISSARGMVRMKAIVSEKVRTGVVFTTFHFPEISINYITSGVGDEFTLTPEYKVVAVDFKKSLIASLKTGSCDK